MTMAKLKSVRFTRSEIQLINHSIFLSIRKLKHSKKNDSLIGKLWQASNTSGEKIDDIEFKRLKERNKCSHLHD